jgi:hypothetical protein
MYVFLHVQHLILFLIYIDVPPALQPVTADTSALMDELMAGTRRNNKKQHISHSNSRESQVCSLNDFSILSFYF